MRAMKDSGIEWIGSIPEHWEVKRLKNVADLNPTFNAQIEQDTLVAYMPMECLRNGIIQERIAPYSEVASYTPFKDDDVVMAKVTPCFENGNIAVATNLQGGYGFGTSEIFVIRCGKEAHNKYAFYYLQSAYIKNLGVSSMTGTGGLKRVNPTILNNSYFLSPSVAEQQAIADYLDEKCAEVDEMIGLQEQIIEELKAYKQSVITEAVTKGLNPAAPMRDSGIEWIGSIPEHWELKPLKFNFKRRSERNNPIVTTERLSLSIDKGVTLYSEKTTNLDRFKEDFTQYQIAHPNDIVLNCMNMIVGAVGLSKYLGCVSPVYYVIYPSNSKIDSEYYSYLLNTPTVRGVYYSYGKGIYAIERGEGRVNTCRLKVSYDDFGRFNIPIPPIEEQKNIVSYIKEKCADVDSLIQTKLSKIDSLKEYKKSIIYEYVTGKREVTE